MSLTYFHDHLGPVWYHSEPSEGPHIFPKTVTGQELFFSVSYSKLALVHTYIKVFWLRKKNKCALDKNNNLTSWFLQWFHFEVLVLEVVVVLAHKWAKCQKPARNWNTILREIGCFNLCLQQFDESSV